MKNLLIIISILFQFNAFSQDSENINTLKSNLNLPGYLKIDIGMTFLETKNHSLKTDVFPSRSIDMYYSKPLFIGDNFSFNPGLGISVDKLSFSNDVILSEVVDIEGNTSIVIDSLSNKPEKNSLKSTYLSLPLDFKYYFGSGTYDKGRFFVGLGAEIGALINSSTKLKQTINNFSAKSKLKKDFGVNDLKYAVSFQIGVGNFNFYYKKHLSNLFGKNSLPTNESINPNINKVGITFSLF